MSYKTELQGNNVDLQSILDIINELPEPINQADVVAEYKNSVLNTAY